MVKKKVDESSEEQDEVEVTETKEIKEAPKKEKKKRGIFKKILMAFGALFLVGVLWLGWLGFVPILSDILGANNPRDLGVRYTEVDLQAFYDITNQEVLDYETAPVNSNGKKTIFADPVKMKVDLSQEEITARIDDLSEWVYMPMSNVQVAFGDNNTIEVSGNLITDVVDDFVGFIGGVGYSDEDVQTGLDWLNKLSANPAIYVKAVGSIDNNQLSLELLDAKVGRWTPPMDEALRVLTTGTLNALAGTQGLDVYSATFSDGTMHFNGQAPTTIYVKER